MNRDFDIELEFFGDYFGNVVGGGPKKSPMPQITWKRKSLLMPSDGLDGRDPVSSFWDTHWAVQTPRCRSIHVKRSAVLKPPTPSSCLKPGGNSFYFNKHFSFKAGLYSLDTEFDVKQTANLFINGVFGTGIDLSEMGRFGPAIYPLSALGVRLKETWEGAIPASCCGGWGSRKPGQSSRDAGEIR